MSMKKFNDTIGNRTRDLPACSATAPPRAPSISSIIIRFLECSTCFEQLCIHPQEDSCINTTSGIITVCWWPSGIPEGHQNRASSVPLVPAPEMTYASLNIADPSAMLYQMNIL
jgi:hypothetical protein